MVNSESMDATSDGSAARERVTQLNSAPVDVGHSSAPLTAPDPCLRQLDFTGENIASTSAEFANPADGASPPETAVTNAENPSLAAAAAAVASSLCCSVPLVKVQEVVLPVKSKKLTRKFLCLYCDRTFVTSSLRQKHVDRCHSSNQARRSSSRFQSKTPTVCIYCKKLNNTDHTLNDLFKHLVEKHPSKYFGCFECDERFSFKSHLEEHNQHTHKPTPNPAEEEDIDNDEEKLRTKHKARLKPDTEKEDKEETKPNLRLRKELRKQKIVVRSTKIKKSTRLQKTQPNPPQQKQTKKRQKSSKLTENSTKTDNDSSVNPYPTFDAYFRVKKITDHSIDNLKISSLTFDDVFDKTFYNRIKCNIQDNLQNHIDGKLFKNEESESRISNFEKLQESSQAIAENFGCDITLNAATPVVSLLSSQLGEDFESQIEYGAKASKKKITVKTDEVHYKYFTRRKYQASILESKENRDLSKLDMWTQIIVKDRQQKIINDQKTDKERIEYTKGIEYKTKIQNEELNRILDRRGPFEDLKQEADRRLGKNIEAISDVTSILDDIFDNIFKTATIKEEAEIFEKKLMKPDISDFPLFLNLKKRSSEDHSDIDRSDKITLICSSQETENFEQIITPRDKNTLVELTGEWTRTRMYICAACGVQVSNMKLLLDHKSAYHPNVWVQHYEFVGNQSDLYKHLSIPGLGKVGYVENIPVTKSYKRSDARECTKCTKMCNSLGELHRHMLECGEDWSWMLARKKLKYRPFGSKSRRKRRGLVKRIIHKEKSDEQRTERKKYQVKVKPIHDGPRQRPSDAETIQRMLANLPAKRATRKLISLKDGFPRRRRTAQTETNAKDSNQQQQKLKTPKSTQQTSKNKQTTTKGLKCNPLKLRKSVRNINKVLGSKILESNTTLRVKRKLKSALQHEIRTRNKERQIEAAAQEIKKPSLLNKVKMIGETMKNKVFGGEKKPKSDDASVKPKRRAEKSVEAEENEVKKPVTKKPLQEEKDDKKETKKETIGSKIVRSLSLRRAKQKQNFLNKSASDSNLSKNVEKEEKNVKKKSTLSAIKSKLKKIRSKTITKIAQVDGSSQISDEILPFLENFHLEERPDSKKYMPNACISQPEILIEPITEAQTFEDISSNLPQEISSDLTSTKTGMEDNPIVEREPESNEVNKETSVVEEEVTQNVFFEDKDQNKKAEPPIDESKTEEGALEIVIKVEPPEETKDEHQLSDFDNTIKQQNSNESKINKQKKRVKGLNDCIAMLTSKLQQKSDGSVDNLTESETGLDLSLNGSKNSLNRLSSEENLSQIDSSSPKLPVIQNSVLPVKPNIPEHPNIIPPQLAAVLPTLQQSLHLGQIATLQNLHQPFLPLIHGLLPNFMFSNAFFAEKALAETLNRQEPVFPSKPIVKPVILNVPKLSINKHLNEKQYIPVEKAYAPLRYEEVLLKESKIPVTTGSDQVDFCLPIKETDQSNKVQETHFPVITDVNEEILQKTKRRRPKNNGISEIGTTTNHQRKSIITEGIMSSSQEESKDLVEDRSEACIENEQKSEEIREPENPKIETIFGRLSSESDTLSFKTVMLNNISDKLGEEELEIRKMNVINKFKEVDVNIEVMSSPEIQSKPDKPKAKAEGKKKQTRSTVKKFNNKIKENIDLMHVKSDLEENRCVPKGTNPDLDVNTEEKSKISQEVPSELCLSTKENDEEASLNIDDPINSFEETTITSLVSDIPSEDSTKQSRKKGRRKNKEIIKPLEVSVDAKNDFLNIDNAIDDILKSVDLKINSKMKKDPPDSFDEDSTRNSTSSKGGRKKNKKKPKDVLDVEMEFQLFLDANEPDILENKTFLESFNTRRSEEAQKEEQKRIDSRNETDSEDEIPLARFIKGQKISSKDFTSLIEETELSLDANKPPNIEETCTKTGDDLIQSEEKSMITQPVEEVSSNTEGAVSTILQKEDQLVGAEKIEEQIKETEENSLTTKKKKKKTPGRKPKRSLERIKVAEATPLDVSQSRQLAQIEKIVDTVAESVTEPNVKTTPIRRKKSLITEVSSSVTDILENDERGNNITEINDRIEISANPAIIKNIKRSSLRKKKSVEREESLSVVGNLLVQNVADGSIPIDTEAKCEETNLLPKPRRKRSSGRKLEMPEEILLSSYNIEDSAKSDQETAGIVADGSIPTDAEAKCEETNSLPKPRRKRSSARKLEMPEEIPLSHYNFEDSAKSDQETAGIVADGSIPIDAEAKCEETSSLPKPRRKRSSARKLEMPEELPLSNYNIEDSTKSDQETAGIVADGSIPIDVEAKCEETNLLSNPRRKRSSARKLEMPEEIPLSHYNIEDSAKSDQETAGIVADGSIPIDAEAKCEETNLLSKPRRKRTSVRKLEIPEETLFRNYNTEDPAKSDQETARTVADGSIPIDTEAMFEEISLLPKPRRKRSSARKLEMPEDASSLLSNCNIEDSSKSDQETSGIVADGSISIDTEAKCEETNFVQKPRRKKSSVRKLEIPEEALLITTNHTIEDSANPDQETAGITNLNELIMPVPDPEQKSFEYQAGDPNHIIETHSTIISEKSLIQTTDEEIPQKVDELETGRTTTSRNTETTPKMKLPVPNIIEDHSQIMLPIDEIQNMTDHESETPKEISGDSERDSIPETVGEPSIDVPIEEITALGQPTELPKQKRKKKALGNKSALNNSTDPSVSDLPTITNITGVLLAKSEEAKFKTPKSKRKKKVHKLHNKHKTNQEDAVDLKLVNVTIPLEDTNRPIPEVDFEECMNNTETITSNQKSQDTVDKESTFSDTTITENNLETQADHDEIPLIHVLGKYEDINLKVSTTVRKKNEPKVIEDIYPNVTQNEINPFEKFPMPLKSVEETNLSKPKRRRNKRNVSLVAEQPLENISTLDIPKDPTEEIPNPTLKKPEEEAILKSDKLKRRNKRNVQLEAEPLENTSTLDIPKDLSEDGSNLTIKKPEEEAILKSDKLKRRNKRSVQLEAEPLESILTLDVPKDPSETPNPMLKKPEEETMLKFEKLKRRNKKVMPLEAELIESNFTADSLKDSSEETPNLTLKNPEEETTLKFEKLKRRNKKVMPLEAERIESDFTPDMPKDPNDEIPNLTLKKPEEENMKSDKLKRRNKKNMFLETETLESNFMVDAPKDSSEETPNLTFTKPEEETMLKFEKLKRRTKRIMPLEAERIESNFMLDTPKDANEEIPNLTLTKPEEETMLKSDKLKRRNKKNMFLETETLQTNFMVDTPNDSSEETPNLTLKKPEEETMLKSEKLKRKNKRIMPLEAERIEGNFTPVTPKDPNDDLPNLTLKKPEEETMLKSEKLKRRNKRIMPPFEAETIESHLTPDAPKDSTEETPNLALKKPEEDATQKTEKLKRRNKTVMPLDAELIEEDFTSDTPKEEIPNLALKNPEEPIPLTSEEVERLNQETIIPEVVNTIIMVNEISAVQEKCKRSKSRGLKKPEESTPLISEELERLNQETIIPEVVNTIIMDNEISAVQEKSKRSKSRGTAKNNKRETPVEKFEDFLNIQTKPSPLIKDPYEFEDTQFVETTLLQKETSISQFPLYNENRIEVSSKPNEENLDFFTKALEEAIAQSDNAVKIISKTVDGNNEDTTSQKTPEKKRKSTDDKKLTSPDDKKKVRKVRRAKGMSLFTDNEDSNEEIGKKARKLKISCQIFQKSNKFSDKSKIAEDEDSSDQYEHIIRKENPFQIPIIKEEIPDNDEEEELPGNSNNPIEETLNPCMPEVVEHVHHGPQPGLYVTQNEEALSYEEQIDKETENVMEMSMEELENEIRRKIQMSNKMLDVQPTEYTREETEDRQKNHTEDSDDDIDQFYKNLQSVVERIDAELKDNSNESVANIFKEDGENTQSKIDENTQSRNEENTQSKNEEILLNCVISSDLDSQPKIVDEKFPDEIEENKTEENNIAESINDENNIEESNFDENNIEEINADENNIKESNTDENNIEEVNTDQNNIEESNTDENNIEENNVDELIVGIPAEEPVKSKRRRRSKGHKEPVEETTIKEKIYSEIPIEENDLSEQSDQFDFIADASSKEEGHFEFQVNAESTNGINKLKIRRRKISEEMYEEKKKKRSHHKKSHNGHKKRRKHHTDDAVEKPPKEKKVEETLIEEALIEEALIEETACDENEPSSLENLGTEIEPVGPVDFDEDMEIEECNMNTSIIENKLTIAESPKLLFSVFSSNSGFKTPNEVSLFGSISEKNDVISNNEETQRFNEETQRITEETVQIFDDPEEEKNKDCDTTNELNESDERFEEREDNEDNFEETPTKAKIRCKKGKAKKGVRNKREKMPGIENLDEVYCDICNKNFTRMENLIKHKKTLTHIAKLSEIEAREAEIKAKQLEKESNAKEQSIGISDILQSEKEMDQEVAKINSPYTIEQNSAINLVDIINEVLDKPLNNEIIYNESFINNAVISETKRYKSLGERKSFESDINTTYPFNNMNLTNETIPKNRNTLLTEQHISILENIVENKRPFDYIDEITDSSNKSNFSNDHNTFMKPNENFLKPPQYEEISNDSSSVRNNFEEQRSRKVLNRDEALFLECCSLLKSSSEVSGFSKKSSKNILHTFEMKPNDEPDWLEAKSLQNKPYPSNDFLNSCPNTPLGDGFGDEYSNTNSNTIATDWSTKQREKDGTLVLDNTSAKEPERNFSHVFPMEKKSEECVSSENDEFEEVYEDNRTSEEFKGKIASKFGGLITKALKNSLQAMKKNSHKEKPQTAEVTQMSITDYAVPISSKPEPDPMDNKKVMTKGAMKVFEGLKVSIPTDDLDLKELLNGSYVAKKPKEPNNLIQQESNPKEEELKKTKKNSLKNFGNSLGLKVTKKKHLSKTNISKEIGKVKNENSKKSDHDVYDFEETQDNTEILGSKLTDIKEFRNKEKEKKLNEPYDIESESESRGCLDSFGFDTHSISSYSSCSTHSSFKKPKETGITKNKCMIMGRIFKNAFKTKVDFRDIPVADNSKMVEDYVNHLPMQDKLEKKKLSPEEMDALFNKLLDDKLPTDGKSEERRIVEKTEEKRCRETKNKTNKTKNSTVKRKRQKHNSESTDDEFSLNKTKKNSKKKSKNTDNAINLEQELRECIGVASRKSQRTCTSGKQNVLVEYWSSDDSNFEAFIRETMSSEKPKKIEKPKKPIVTEVKKPEPILKAPVIKKIDKANKQVSRKPKIKKPDEDPEDKKLKKVKVTAETLAANRRKRPAADTLYYWSSSSEDESQDFIELKPIRDEIYDDDDDDDIPVQHGWIVGESPKKLVTMLAQAKGKKTDAETSVKEQGRKRTTV